MDHRLLHRITRALQTLVGAWKRQSDLLNHQVKSNAPVMAVKYAYITFEMNPESLN